MKRPILVLSILLCTALLAAPAAARADTLGVIKSAEHDGQGYVFACENGRVRITVVDAGVLRVEAVRTGEQFYTPSELLRGDGCAELENAGDRYVVRCDSTVVEALKDPFALRFITADGKTGLETLPDGGFELQGRHYALRFRLEDDSFYGLGEPDQRGRELQLDLRGFSYPVWNLHPSPSRLIIPFLISSRGYGLFFDNAWKANIDIGETFHDTLAYSAEGGDIRFYVFLAPDPLALLEKYTSVTGRPPMPPLWALGYIQSKYGYKNRAEVEALADTFRAKGIPCDGIILDLYWFKEMGDLDFDTKNWPDPAGMIAGLRAKGFHVFVIEEPYITTPSPNHAAGLEAGIFTTDASGRPYVFKMWKGPASLVDFSNAKAREWWISRHEKLIGYGIEGWWTDLNEPETDFHDMAFAGGPVYGQHNRQALLMQEAVHAAVKRYKPDMRPFILSRSAFAGSQRYGTAVWSGDVGATWNDLARQPVLGQNTSMAGLPLWNSDIGGFWGHPTPELYLRWLQFGLFTPLCRPHGAFSPREPWQYGWQVERMAKEAIETRYSLIPYIYGLLYRAHTTGEPLMRPLFTAYPDDRNVFNLGDQYLFGPSLLVAPVTAEGARNRKVYLPAGRWYDFWTGSVLEGDREITADAPLERIPVFVKAGAVIPRVDPKQHTDEMPWTVLMLEIYPGENGSFTLYEDDGRTNDYLNGSYSTTRIVYNESELGVEITIEPPEGDPTVIPADRLYIFKVFGIDKPWTVTCNGEWIPEIAGKSDLSTGEEGWRYNKQTRQLIITPPQTRERVRLVVEPEK
jgi:alpha-glucosidase